MRRRFFALVLLLLLLLLTACRPAASVPTPGPTGDIAPTPTGEYSSIPPEDPATTEEPPAVLPEDPATTEKPPSVQPEDPATTEKPPSVQPEDPATTEEPPSALPEDPATTEEPSSALPEDPATTEEPPTVQPEDPVTTEEPPTVPPEDPATTEMPPEIPEEALSQEADALANAPAALPVLLLPAADGLLVEENSRAVIDYSHREDGYVMVRYTAETSQQLKVRVFGPQTTYTYNLTPGKWEAFPLSDGSGTYKVAVYQNVTENRYSTVLTLTCDVALTDEFAPYLRPNQYVDYSGDSAAVIKAAEVAGKIDDPLKKVEAVYDFVVDELSYDREKAATVKSGYLPDLDQVLAVKKGICFDYAALMAAMLRSQGVPCKLVVGYAGTAYHAWISVWTEEQGWVDGVIFFDGHAWHRMDPTFASSADQSAEIMQYIGDGANYTAKYLY